MKKLKTIVWSNVLLHFGDYDLLVMKIFSFMIVIEIWCFHLDYIFLFSES